MQYGIIYVNDSDTLLKLSRFWEMSVCNKSEIMAAKEAQSPQGHFWGREEGKGWEPGSNSRRDASLPLGKTISRGPRILCAQTVTQSAVCIRPAGPSLAL